MECWCWNKVKNRLSIANGIKASWKSISHEKKNGLKEKKAITDCGHHHKPSVVSSVSIFLNAFCVPIHSNLGLSVKGQAILI